jgi:hypothetical protein
MKLYSETKKTHTVFRYLYLRKSIQAYAYLLVLIKGNMQPKFEMIGLKNSKWSLICDCRE